MNVSRASVADAEIHEIFEHAPFALCELDIGRVEAKLVALAEEDDTRTLREQLASDHSRLCGCLCQAEVLAANRSAMDMAGIKHGGDIKQLIDRLVPGPAADIVAVELTRLASGQLRGAGEFSIGTGCECNFSCTFSWALLPENDGQATRVVLSMVDDTERVQAESELRRHEGVLEQTVAKRTAELNVAKERAEQSDYLKSAFLATMSHELRTPLNSIIGFTGILLQELAGPLNEEQGKQLEMVRASSRHLLALVNDVLDLSKIEAGQLTVAREPFDVGSVIREGVRIVEPRAAEKGLTIDCDIGPAVGVIMGDARRTGQIVLNLLDNAVKFTEQGSVRLTCRVEDGHIRIDVADTGIGIKAEDLTMLFRPFRQIDSGLTRRHMGTGLGLSVCKSLSSLLGGDVDVVSRWGNGSVFTLRLPMDMGGAKP